MQSQKGLVHVLLHNRGGLHGVLSFPPLMLGRQVLEEGTAAMLVLHFQEMLGALALFNQLTEEVAHVLQSHIEVAEIEAQREVSVGGPQLQVDQAVDRVLHLGRIILRNLGARGYSAIRN